MNKLHFFRTAFLSAALMQDIVQLLAIAVVAAATLMSSTWYALGFILLAAYGLAKQSAYGKHVCNVCIEEAEREELARGEDYIAPDYNAAIELTRRMAWAYSGTWAALGAAAVAIAIKGV